jgi:hypothetical protein
MKSARLVSFGLGLLATALAAAATGQPQASATRALPITPLAHLSTIQVSLNGTGPYTFVVDTGAGVAVINEDLAKTLDLPVVGSTEVGSPMGTAPIKADSLAIATMTLGEVVVKGAAGIAMNLNQIFAPMKAPDGILAAASIEDHLLTINFPEGYVVLHPGALPPADGGRILEYQEQNVVPRVSLSVAGEPVMATLDCGAPAGLSLPTSYVDKLPLAAAPQVSGRGRTVDAEFEIVSSELLGTIELGSIRIHNPTISFNGRSETANIGMGILRDYSVTIDRTNRRIAFDRPTDSDGGTEPRRRVKRMTGGGRGYGIRLGGLAGDILAVLDAETGLPAAAAGLQSGDQIVALNGIAVKSLSGEERIAALRGSPLVLLVERNGKELELTMSHE